MNDSQDGIGRFMPGLGSVTNQIYYALSKWSGKEEEDTN